MTEITDSLLVEGWEMRHAHIEFAKYRAYEDVMDTLGELEGEEAEEGDEVYVWSDGIEGIMIQWARGIAEGFKIIGILLGDVNDDRLIALLDTGLLTDLREIHATIQDHTVGTSRLNVPAAVTHLNLRNLSRRTRFVFEADLLEYLSIRVWNFHLTDIQDEDPYFERTTFDQHFRRLEFLRIPHAMYDHNMEMRRLIHLDLSQYDYTDTRGMSQRILGGNWMGRHKRLVSLKTGPISQSAIIESMTWMTELVEYDVVRSARTGHLRLPLSLPNLRMLSFKTWQDPREGTAVPWSRVAPYKNLLELSLTTMRPIHDYYKNIDFSRFKNLQKLTLTANNEISEILWDLPEGVDVHVEGLPLTTYVENVELFEDYPEDYTFTLEPIDEDLTHLLKDSTLARYPKAFNIARDVIIKWIRKNSSEQI